MPAPGDQHRSVTNPFEDGPPRISEYTAKEIATLQSRLERQLGPEYISTRAGPAGQKVHYITAEKCIQLANEVFGFNGWSSSIQNIQVDFVDEKPDGRVSLGLSVVIRVSLRDGTYHEDLGYGHIENCKGKAAAFEKAKKEGTTDGLKRALRNFGNVLGNCIYDKEYLKKVTRIKSNPVRFDEANLHRYGASSAATAAAAQPVKKENLDVKKEKEPETQIETQLTARDPEDVDFLDQLGDFDDADLCIQTEGHPDEVVLSHTGNNAGPQARSIHGDGPAPQTPNPAAQRNRGHGGQAAGPQGRAMPPHHHQRPNMAPPGQGPTMPGNQAPKQLFNDDGTPYTGPPAVFLSAKAAGTGPESAGSGGSAALLQSQQFFNPKVESPSIRKTPGVDHSSSKPVKRAILDPLTATDAAAAAAPTGNTSSVGTVAGSGPQTRAAAGPGGGVGGGHGNVVHPHLNQTRRIGAPAAGGGSPMANRGQYRAPTMKRPHDGPNTRTPLGDVPTNEKMNVQNVSGIDAKRQKMA